MTSTGRSVTGRGEADGDACRQQRLVALRARVDEINDETTARGGSPCVVHEEVGVRVLGRRRTSASASSPRDAASLHHHPTTGGGDEDDGYRRESPVASTLVGGGPTSGETVSSTIHVCAAVDVGRLLREGFAAADIAIVETESLAMRPAWMHFAWAATEAAFQRQGALGRPAVGIVFLLLQIVWLVQSGYHSAVSSVSSDDDGRRGAGPTHWRTIVIFAALLPAAVLNAAAEGLRMGLVYAISRSEEENDEAIIYGTSRPPLMSNHDDDTAPQHTQSVGKKKTAYSISPPAIGEAQSQQPSPADAHHRHTSSAMQAICRGTTRSAVMRRLALSADIIGFVFVLIDLIHVGILIRGARGVHCLNRFERVGHDTDDATLRFYCLYRIPEGLVTPLAFSILTRSPPFWAMAYVFTPLAVALMIARSALEHEAMGIPNIVIIVQVLLIPFIWVLQLAFRWFVDRADRLHYADRVRAEGRMAHLRVEGEALSNFARELAPRMPAQPTGQRRRTLGVSMGGLSTTGQLTLFGANTDHQSVDVVAAAGGEQARSRTDQPSPSSSEGGSGEYVAWLQSTRDYSPNAVVLTVGLLDHQAFLNGCLPTAGAVATAAMLARVHEMLFAEETSDMPPPDVAERTAVGYTAVFGLTGGGLAQREGSNGQGTSSVFLAASLRERALIAARHMARLVMFDLQTSQVMGAETDFPRLCFALHCGPVLGYFPGASASTARYCLEGGGIRAAAAMVRCCRGPNKSILFSASVVEALGPAVQDIADRDDPIQFNVDHDVTQYASMQTLLSPLEDYQGKSPLLAYSSLSIDLNFQPETISGREKRGDRETAELEESGLKASAARDGRSPRSRDSEGNQPQPSLPVLLDDEPRTGGWSDTTVGAANHNPSASHTSASLPLPVPAASFPADDSHHHHGGWGTDDCYNQSVARAHALMSVNPLRTPQASLRLEQGHPPPPCGTNAATANSGVVAMAGNSDGRRMDEDLSSNNNTHQNVMNGSTVRGWDSVRGDRGNAGIAALSHGLAATRRLLANTRRDQARRLLLEPAPLIGYVSARTDQPVGDRRRSSHRFYFLWERLRPVRFRDPLVEQQFAEYQRHGRLRVPNIIVYFMYPMGWASVVIDFFLSWQFWSATSSTSAPALVAPGDLDLLSSTHITGYVLALLWLGGAIAAIIIHCRLQPSSTSTTAAAAAISGVAGQGVKAEGGPVDGHAAATRVVDVEPVETLVAPVHVKANQIGPSAPVGTTTTTTNTTTTRTTSSASPFYSFYFSRIRRVAEHMVLSHSFRAVSGLAMLQLFQPGVFATNPLTAHAFGPGLTYLDPVPQAPLLLPQLILRYATPTIVVAIQLWFLPLVVLEVFLLVNFIAWGCMSFVTRLLYDRRDRAGFVAAEMTAALTAALAEQMGLRQAVIASSAAPQMRALLEHFAQQGSAPAENPHPTNHRPNGDDDNLPTFVVRPTSMTAGNTAPQKNVRDGVGDPGGLTMADRGFGRAVGDYGAVVRGASGRPAAVAELESVAMVRVRFDRLPRRGGVGDGDLLVQAAEDAHGYVRFVAAVDALIAARYPTLAVIEARGCEVLLGGPWGPSTSVDLADGENEGEDLEPSQRYVLSVAGFVAELRGVAEALATSPEMRPFAVTAVATVDDALVLMRNPLYPAFDVHGPGPSRLRALLAAAPVGTVCATEAFVRALRHHHAAADEQRRWGLVSTPAAGNQACDSIPVLWTVRALPITRVHILPPSDY